MQCTRSLPTFCDLLYGYVVVYLDDILVLPGLLLPWRYLMYAKLEKCLFKWTSLLFLGYVIYNQGLLKDPKEQTAVLHWLCLVGLLGFVNYYRQFNPHFPT